ncbi:Uncharacterized protein APZ42_029007 [Daphnia magna]|uniref:Uncharacterized protein n=1 Tax=Daphnia magna TaxID=35525 RepID=A0A164PZR3_9CRUS|nr:Uncharacterized protein APZ42_029007 [Daphnia magna]
MTSGLHTLPHLVQRPLYLDSFLQVPNQGCSTHHRNLSALTLTLPYDVLFV